jgi:hypothetical protein
MDMTVRGQLPLLPPACGRHVSDRQFVLCQQDSRTLQICCVAVSTGGAAPRRTVCSLKLTAPANVFVAYGFPMSPQRVPWMKIQSSRCPKLYRARPLSSISAVSDEQQTISGRCG